MATRTLIVGDSLGVGTAPWLRRRLGGRVDEDTVVGRSSADGVRSALGKGGRRYDRVVFDLGTNDGSAQQLVQSLRRALRAAPNARFIVPTVNGPGAAEKNAALRRVAGGRVRLVDWAGGSGGLVGGDGIHASPAGYRARAGLVARELYAARPQRQAFAPAREQMSSGGANVNWLEQVLNGLAARKSQTGGELAPVEAAPQVAADAPQSPVQELLRGYQAFLGKSGAQVDPLQREGYAPVPVEGKTGFDAAAVVNQLTGNPRAGRAYSSFEKDGARFHVYYDADGRRQVVWAGGKRPASLPKLR